MISVNAISKFGNKPLIAYICIDMLIQNKILLPIYFLLLIIGCSLTTHAQSKVIQVSGLVRNADSSDLIRYVGIYVKSTPKGTMTNENGFFNIVCNTGDTLLIAGMGYQSKEFIIPNNLTSNFYNTTQYLVQDTFYLPEAYIRPYLTPEQFEWEMVFGDYDTDLQTIVKRNISKSVIKSLMATQMKSNIENQAMTQNNIFEDLHHKGIIQSGQQLMNPFSWARFYEAVKRGDFKKKKKY